MYVRDCSLSDLEMSEAVFDVIHVLDGDWARKCEILIQVVLSRDLRMILCDCESFSSAELKRNGLERNLFNGMISSKSSSQRNSRTMNVLGDRTDYRWLYM